MYSYVQHLCAAKRVTYNLLSPALFTHHYAKDRARILPDSWSVGINKVVEPNCSDVLRRL